MEIFRIWVVFMRERGRFCIGVYFRERVFFILGGFYFRGLFGLFVDFSVVICMRRVICWRLERG